MRRRPIGAILADICRDFGIAPSDLDGSFWDELNLAIISYGGTIAGIIDGQITDPSPSPSATAPTNCGPRTAHATATTARHRSALSPHNRLI